MRAMTKRLLSMLVVLAMVLSMVPVVGLPAITANAAASTADITAAADALMATFEAANGEPVTADCPHCGSSKSWVPLTADICNNTAKTASVHYYLPADLETSSSVLRISGGSNISCVHLNGKTLTCSNDTYAFHAGTSSPTLSIMGQGNVNYTGSGAMVQTTQAFVNFYGGTYTATNGVLFNNGSAKNVHFRGNTIMNGKVVAIRTDSSAEYMFLYENATIAELELDANAKVQLAAGWTGTVNKLSYTDAATAFGTRVEVSGTAAGTVYSADGTKYITSGGALVPDAGGEEPEVDTPEVGVFAPESCGGLAYCEACGEDAGAQTWTALTAAGVTITAAGSNHYYLPSGMENDTLDMGNTMAVSVKTGSVCLHLNGKTITGTADKMFFAGGSGTLNIMGEGTVAYTGTGAAYDFDKSSFNVFGGTHTAANGTLVESRSTLKTWLYGDTIFNGSVRLNRTADSSAEKIILHDNVQITSLYLDPTALLELADGWNGSITSLTLDGVDVTAGASIATTKIDNKGTLGESAAITLNTGDTLEYDAESACFKVVSASGGEEPEVETPVVGVFNPGACGGLAYCPICGEDAGAQTWTGVNGNVGAVTETLNHIYLSSSVEFETGTDDWFLSTASGKTTHFNTNGFNIAPKESATTANAISNGGTLELFNTSETVSELSGHNPNGYGNFYLSGGTVKLHEKVTLKAVSVNTKPVVTVATGTFYLEGGKISSEGTTMKAVQVRNDGSGSFVLNSGTIASGSANAIEGGQGGAADKANTVVLNGGTITGGTVIIKSGTLTLNNAASPESLITINANGKLIVDGGWDGEASVKFVSTLEEDENGNRFVPAANGEALGAFTGTLTLDGDGRELQKDETTSKLAVGKPPKDVFNPGAYDGEAWCPVCGDYKTWTAIAADARPADSVLSNTALTGEHHFYFSASGTYDAKQFFIGGNTADGIPTVCLNLNGMTKTLGGRIALYNNITFNVMDTAGTGEIKFAGSTTNGNDAHSPSLFDIAGTGTLNLHSGTFSVDGTTKPIVDMGAAGSVNINNDGVIINGDVKVEQGVFTLAKNAEITKIDVAETGKLVVNSDFTGAATVSFATAPEEGNLVPAANGAATGDYTGTLTDTTTEEKIVHNAGRLQVVIVPKDAFNPTYYGKAWCEACGAYVDAADWTAVHAPLGTTAENGKHYYIASDFTDDGTTRLATTNGSDTWKSGKICFNLNGQEKTIKNGFYIASTSELNMMGEGKLTYDGESGQLFSLYTNYLNIYGGTYEGTTVISTGGTGQTQLFGNTKINGAIVTLDTKTGPVTIYGAVEIESLYIPATGKLTIADGWTGKIDAISFGFDLAEGNLVPAERAVVAGAFTGTIKMADDRNVVRDTTNTAQLKVEDYDFDPAGHNNYSYCPVCGIYVTWSVVNGNVGAVTETLNHIYLSSSVEFETGTDDWFLSTASGKTTHFNTNGFNIAPKESATTANAISNGGTLELFNTSETVSELSGHNPNGYGNFYVSGGTVKLHEKVTLKAVSVNTRPVVTVAGGTFMLDGGKISSEGTTMKAVQVRNVNSGVTCSFVLNSGTIASGSANAIEGGQSGVSGKGNTVVLNGGTITGGTVIIKAGTLTLNNAASPESLITINTYGKLIVGDGWDGEASVTFAVNNPTNAGDLVSADNAEVAGTFTGTLIHSTTTRLLVKNDTNAQLKLGDTVNPPQDVFDPESWGGKAYCPVCKDYKTWTAIAANVRPDDTSLGSNKVTMGGAQSGEYHYYFAVDGSYTAKQFFEGGSESAVSFCLNLNGTTRTLGGRISLGNNITFNVLDTSADNSGEIKFTGSTTNNNATQSANLFFVGGNGQLNLYGGTFSVNSTTNPIVNMTGEGAVNIKNDNVTINGRVTATKGTFTMDGGEINGITADYGGCINANGTTSVTINAGTLQNGTATVAGGNIYATNTDLTIGANAIIQNGTAGVENATTGNGGGNIFFGKGTLTTSGTITGGKVHAYNGAGGNIFLDNGQTVGTNFIMNGGEISGGQMLGHESNGSTGQAYGANIRAYRVSTVAFNAGTISGGIGGADSRAHGRDVFISTKSDLTTNVTIGNGFQLNGAYYQGGDSTLTLVGAPQITGAGISYSVAADVSGLTAGANVKMVDVPVGEAFATNATEAMTGYFTVEGKTVLYKEGGLYIGAAKVGETWYTTTAEAVTAAGESGVVVMGAEGAIEIPADTIVTVDAAGYDVTVTGTGTLRAMDSANKTLVNTTDCSGEDFDGFAVWTVTGVTLEPVVRTGDDIYVVIVGDTEDTYTTHYLDIRLYAVNLRTSNAGLYYTTQYKCDSKLAKKVNTHGVILSVEDGNSIPTTISVAGIATDSNNICSTYSGAVTGILSDDAALAVDNAENAQIDVYANPYLVIETCAGKYTEVRYDVNADTTDDVGFSLASALQTINANWDASWMTAQAKTIVAKFYEKWSTVFEEVDTSSAEFDFSKIKELAETV